MRFHSVKFSRISGTAESDQLSDALFSYAQWTRKLTDDLQTFAQTWYTCWSCRSCTFLTWDSSRVRMPKLRVSICVKISLRNANFSWQISHSNRLGRCVSWCDFSSLLSINLWSHSSHLMNSRTKNCTVYEWDASVKNSLECIWFEWNWMWSWIMDLLFFSYMPD